MNEISLNIYNTIIYAFFQYEKIVNKITIMVRKVETMQYLFAFLAGGTLCLIGQVLIDKTSLTPARILTGYVVAGVLLSAVGLYEPLANFAGAGASIPLSGFGHLMAQGVRDAIDKDGAIGILTGALTAASAGIGAAVVLSLIAGLISKPKEK